MNIDDPTTDQPRSEDERVTRDSGPQPTVRATAVAAPQTHIGPYRLLQAIGEGGFGTVYVAEQEAPVRRRVAVKIIKAGMDTREVIARFEAERQALAMMDHPNIARVLDAGETPTGRSYFVMELVKGVPITEYCDTNNLAPAERLSLFMDVCRAVQHAHQKGIIHRDIKPSNVLVTMHDGRPMPKVIDFGIAKATNHRLTEKTVFTQLNQLIGTPQYMSPEQAEMSGLDVDTRADIYSLGVLLYELLTGTTPFDPRKLREAAYGELQRIIREEEPPKPSTRLSTLGENASEIARHRHTDPNTLRRVLRGDLDWIVMKAMEKDRTRRYETAVGLAMDIQRHLDDEPVLASPPSAAYRFSKFARRHRAGLVTAAVVVVALLAGLAMATYGLVKATRERDRAEAARAEAEAVTDFVIDMIGAAEPGQRGREITVYEVLDEAVSGLSTSLKDQPRTKARFRATLGKAFRELGIYDKAETQLQEAFGIGEQLMPVDDPDLVRWHHRTRYELALLQYMQSRYDTAREALDAIRDDQTRAFGAEDPDVLRTLNLIGLAHWRTDDSAKAERLFDYTLRVRRRVLGPRDPNTLDSINNLAMLRHEAGQLDGAEQLYREAIRVRTEMRDAEDQGVLLYQSNLGDLLRRQGRLDESIALLESTLAARQRVLGESHLRTLASANQLAQSYAAAGRSDDAEEQFRSAVTLMGVHYGAGHLRRLSFMRSLAGLLVEEGRADDARQVYIDAIASAEPAVSLRLRGELGGLLTRLEAFEDAERALLAAHAGLPAGDSYERTLSESLADLYAAWGRPEDAAKWRGRFE